MLLTYMGTSFLVRSKLFRGVAGRKVDVSGEQRLRMLGAGSNLRLLGEPANISRDMSLFLCDISKCKMTQLRDLLNASAVLSPLR